MKCGKLPPHMKKAALETCIHHIANLKDGKGVEEAATFLKVYIDQCVLHHTPVLPI